MGYKPELSQPAVRKVCMVVVFLSTAVGHVYCLWYDTYDTQSYDTLHNQPSVHVYPDH